LPVDLLAGLTTSGAVSPLAASLAAWCASGGDIAAAAARLHVHANTLRYRLKRAEERTGIDLTSPDQTLVLTLLLDPV
ncbi:MAG: helix-turn-helix domain-containing protein, partial [Actinomycetota bacterium]|nr:helix-turn-helix domain-containing protein [Actinomycetota bacterium]